MKSEKKRNRAKASVGTFAGESSNQLGERETKRAAVLFGIDVAMKECAVERLWHWGKPPKVAAGVLMPSDLQAEPPKWSNVGTLIGYWLAPGEPRTVQEIEHWRNSIKSCPDIQGKVTATSF